ncbi:hypothetical protein D3C81_2087760 [compost metagenome]
MLLNDESIWQFPAAAEPEEQLIQHLSGMPPAQLLLPFLPLEGTLQQLPYQAGQVGMLPKEIDHPLSHPFHEAQIPQEG